MKPLYAFAALVPAGMLLGFVGGKASHPEMKFHRSQILPASVIEHADRIEPYRPIYEAGPQDLNPRGVSYRPDLDYSFEYYPPQDVAALASRDLAEADYASAAAPLEANYGDPQVLSMSAAVSISPRSAPQRRPRTPPKRRKCQGPNRSRRRRAMRRTWTGRIPWPSSRSPRSKPNPSEPF